MLEFMLNLGAKIASRFSMQDKYAKRMIENFNTLYYESKTNLENLQKQFDKLTMQVKERDEYIAQQSYEFERIIKEYQAEMAFFRQSIDSYIDRVEDIAEIMLMDNQDTQITQMTELLKADIETIRKQSEHMKTYGLSDENEEEFE